MQISEQSFSELEAVVTDYEKENGVIDLDALVTTNCQCTGAHCSTGCSGNKGQVW